jgi:hypothetical protein
VIVTTNLIPTPFAAFTVWPFIFVLPQMADNKGLIEHELVHYREQRLCLTLPWWMLYLLSRKFRMAAEVRAYKRQIEVGGISRANAASFLLNYRLGITYGDALDALAPQPNKGNS